MQGCIPSKIECPFLWRDIVFFLILWMVLYSWDANFRNFRGFKCKENTVVCLMEKHPKTRISNPKNESFRPIHDIRIQAAMYTH